MITNNNLADNFSEINLAERLKKLSELCLSDSKRIFRKSLANYEQRSYSILLMLSKEGPQSIKKISFILNVTHPAIVQIVNKLIKRKLVEKYDSPEDKRITLIKITSIGKNVLDQLRSTADKINQSYIDLINEVDPKFLITLSLLEEKIKSKSILSRFNEKLKNEQIKSVKIIKYNSEHKNKFKELNLEWLEKYFEVEEEDIKALNNPEEYYIKKGGEIFFALLDNDICGTCAVKKLSADIFELSKMAVTENYQGKQIGKKLALTAIGYAYEKGAKKIVLETSPKLVSAINLYKKLGFEILNEMNGTNYKRTLFKMELELK